MELFKTDGAKKNYFWSVIKTFTRYLEIFLTDGLFHFKQDRVKRIPAFIETMTGNE